MMKYMFQNQTQDQVQKQMRSRPDIWLHVLLNLNMIMLAAVCYLLYQLRMSEDMIKELNRDYEEVSRHYEELLRTGVQDST